VARGGDGSPGRLRLREGGRTAVGRRGERRSRWRGRRGGAAAAQGSGGVGLRQRE
jgi:hypothetical protein